jgi:hypothetical protein
MSARFSPGSLAAFCIVAACGSLAGCGGFDASGSSTISSSSPSAGNSADTFSDEFDDASSVVDWALGPSDAFDAHDIDETTPGHLSVVIGQYAFWHDGRQGFLLFKTVTGDFAVRTRIAIDRIDAPGMDPTGAFHSGGIMLRDPASDPGIESWIMYDLGKQNAITPRGTRFARTASAKTKFELTASADGVTSGELTVCRIGDTFHFARRLEGETSWTTTQTIVRSDLPQSLQVGLAANAGYATNPDLVATFDFARLTIPSTAADCTADR